ncbi:MAG: threonylcarbamoyl-AMP synthase [Bacteroidetes bacterium]|nr:threonylcarbamoyl-AMP synthase [Bacteroidota bacterium]MBK9412530.1 threonylcarbamoyl-AMP synthase [Bacteroidota bacterium]MBP6657556.1 threonylcarbamoyl-AMP synthase [Bacteroidia bacterium]
MNEQVKAEVKKSLAVLKNGGVILYPTDTVWGLGCDATNPEAVRKIYEIKKRADSKTMILLVDLEARLSTYVKEIPEQAWPLIEFTDKPLTIVYDGARNLPPELIAEDGSIAIRVTNDEFCKNLIGVLRKPLVSTSANISGSPAPAIYQEVSEEIRSSVDYVVNWRKDDRQRHAPSSIIKLQKGGLIQIIRP